MSLQQEIHQQPEVIQGALDRNREHVERIAAAFQEVDTVFIAARGTSDNAARYAQYLWGMHNRLPVILAGPSMFSLYQRPPRLPGSLVVGISQSGQSPDIVKVLVEGRRQGCPTLAITNAPDSPLAQAADDVLNVFAGQEKAVAATKSYTAQLLAVAMLSVAISSAEDEREALDRLPGWILTVLEQDAHIAQSALRYCFMQHCAVLGRGYNYATAFEWSLKLKELTYVVAEPYSSADFQHGPIAMVGRGFPVLAIASSGVLLAEITELLQRLKQDKQSDLVVISDQESALSHATTPIPLPPGIPEWLSPLVGIVPAQLFSYHLARVKGYDTESPRGLSKVTLTR